MEFCQLLTDTLRKYVKFMKKRLRRISNLFLNIVKKIKLFLFRLHSFKNIYISFESFFFLIFNKRLINYLINNIPLCFSTDKPMDPSPLPPSPPPCNKKSHCPHCEAAFTRRSSLRVHLDSIHNDRPDVAAQCDKCPLVFMSLTGLRG